MADIIYNGGLEELKSLYDSDGKINEDKLLDWLVSSKNIEYDENVSRELKKKLRKAKINKLNK
jgi:hypothetical protein